MEVAAGGAHFLSLVEVGSEGGSVYTWGGNEYGQLGDQFEVARPRPIFVMKEVIAVACGWNHSLAITRFRECVCWGSNCCGQLGNGTLTDSSTPVEVLDNVLAVAGGFGHSLAVVDVPGLAQTQCYAWGANVSEGNSSACRITGVGHFATKPNQVRNLTNACRLAAGRNHSLVVKRGGDLFSWGRNNFGQLGNGASLNQLVPQRVMQNVRAAAAGMDFSVAVQRHGACFAWGRNRNCEVGDGSTLDRHVPVKVLDGVRTVVAGHSHVLAILGNGDCVSWGRNTCECVCSVYEHTGPGDVPTPLRVLQGVSTVLAAESQSVALLTSGAYQVWGRNWSGIAHGLGALGGMAYLRQAPAAGPTLGDLSAIEVEDDLTIWVPPKQEVTIDVDPELFATYFRKPSPKHAEAEGADADAEQAGATEGAGDAEPEPELTLEEVRKLHAAAEAVWIKGAMEKHGKDVHERVHGRALAQGRPYALRWAEFRRRRVQEIMASGGTGSTREPSRATTPSGAVKTVHLPRDLQLASELQRDDKVLQQFHAEMWKMIDSYKRHKETSNGDEAFVKAWPKEDHDLHSGVLALEKSLRKACKATTKKDNLFDTPPLTPRSRKEKALKEQRRRSREERRSVERERRLSKEREAEQSAVAEE